MADDEPPRFTISHTHRNAHLIEWDIPKPRDGEIIARALCRSDVHHDHKHQDREMEKRHLEQAVEYGAPIIGNGDLLDIMQSQHDPRREVQGVREDIARLMSDGLPEEDWVPPNGVPYVDAIVGEARQFYAPYSHLMVMMGRGNHDQGPIKNLGVDPLEHICRALRDDNPDSRVVSGGYSGWVRFRFTLTGHAKRAITLYHYHGHGGSAPVTGGAIDLYRQAAHADADVVWVGHKHTELERTLPTWGLTSQSGKPEQRERLTFFTPGYVMEPHDGHSGFMTERAGNAPKPRGQVWLEFRYQRKGKKVLVERRRAK